MNLWRIEGEQARLALHPGQVKAWESERRFVFVIAGSQGGKTSFGPWWLWRETQKRGKGDYLAVTASYDLFKLKMLPEMRQVFEHLLGIGRYWAGDKILELKDPETGRFTATRSDDAMWGRIILRSAQSSGGLESATALAAWLDECGQDDFTLENWEAVQARLALSEGRVLGTTTPYNVGWLKSEVYDSWANGDPDFDVINFESRLNPSFPAREFDRQRLRMQTWRFDMRYRGLLTQPAGLIYSDFTDDLLEDPFPIPDDWRRGLGIDFGGANNAILFFAEEPGTERWHLYHEWLGGGQTTADYVAIAKERIGERYVDEKPVGLEYEAWGGAHSEDQLRRDWANAGLTIMEPPVSEVEPGIDRATELIKGKRLRVFRTCHGFRDEIGTYRRKVDDQGNVLEDIVAKREFHRMDALRYFACGVVSGPPAAGQTVNIPDSNYRPTRRSVIWRS